MDANLHIEAAACSLVREYLSRKGFRSTLDKMDEECPRNERSINNRQALMKHMHLDKLMKKNKEQQCPLKTMLEIMTQYFLEKGGPLDGDGPNGHHNNQNTGHGLHQTFEPTGNDSAIRKPSTKPFSVPLKSRRASANDLVMDEDVDGETVLGAGKSGLLAATESVNVAPTKHTKSHTKRPLSAKQLAGPLMSNNELLASRRRGSPAKPSGFSRLSVSQQRQQLTSPGSTYDDVPTDSTNDNDFSKSLNSSAASNLSSSSMAQSKADSDSTPSQEGHAPISFEALLLKGEERANLLQRVGLDRKVPAQESDGYRVEYSSMVGERPPSRHSQRKSSSSQVAGTNRISDLEVGDLDDLDTDVSCIELQRSSYLLQQTSLVSKFHSVAIDIKTAINLKNLILGSPSQTYTEEWSSQAFAFCDIPDLKYGIVQKKGGPCGVLAAVQACLIQELVFGPEKLHAHKWSHPTRAERTKFLAHAIAKLLWRAGNEERAVVTIPSQTTHLVSSSKFRQDGITETLSLYTFTNFEDLSTFLLQSISQFEMDGNPGVILLMYSAILSRKPHVVKSDFDVPESKMIAAHGYCTQELVNLLLTGRAASNVFNDVVELESGDGQDSVLLKGISGRSDIGFLSLFEHYKSCQVGTFYKTPKYPVWLICSESHFSVLFSTRRDLVNDWKAEKRFDLIYYDGLARQQDEIKLTVSTINPSYKPSYSEEDLVPPLELIIRTKWMDAEIDWNGYEPIL